MWNQQKHSLGNGPYMRSSDDIYIKKGDLLTTKLDLTFDDVTSKRRNSDNDWYLEL